MSTDRRGWAAHSHHTDSARAQGAHRGRWRPAVAVGVLALASSASSLANGLVYDDRSIILLNPRVHHLAHIAGLWRETYWPPWMGAGLYRPLTMSAYTLEWAAGGGAPWVFHAANVVLYVATCLVVYGLATLVLPRAAAVVAGALFAVHPVHVEAVGNVVGQSELLAALGVVSAVALYIRWRRAALTAESGAGPSSSWRDGVVALGAPWHSAAIAALVLSACLAKEHAIVAPALIAAAELLVVGDGRPWRSRWRALRPLALLLLATVLAYAVVRARIVGAWAGDRPNVIFEHLTPAARRWTMLGVVAEWARLLFWPARLATEYAPRAIALYPRFELRLLPSIGLLAALAALFGASVRRWPVGAFALAWLANTLLLMSNLVVPTGVILAERTLFLPSVGAALLVAAAAVRIARAIRVTAAGRRAAVRLTGELTMAVLVAAAVWRSAVRQLVWRSSATLFTQGVIDAPLSYRAHDVYAGMLFDTGDRVHGEREARIALAIYPHDAALYRDLANEYMRGGLCTPAIPLLQRAIAEATIQTDAHALLAECLLAQGDPAAARREVLRGVAGGSYGSIYHHILMSADSVDWRAHSTSGASRGVAGVTGQ